MRHRSCCAVALLVIAGCRRGDIPSGARSPPAGAVVQPPRSEHLDADAAAVTTPSSQASRARYVASVHSSLGGDAIGFLSSGRRIVRDGTRDRVVDSEPLELRSVMRMPDAFGRGFVFLGDLDAYGAERFDGPLVPLVQRADRAGRIAAMLGYGAVYLQYSGEPLRRFTMPEGKEEPLDIAGLTNILADPRGFAVALTERDVLYADAPAAFRRLQLPPARDLFWDGGAIVDTTGGYFRIEKGARLEHATYTRAQRDAVRYSDAQPWVERANLTIDPVKPSMPFEACRVLHEIEPVLVACHTQPGRTTVHRIEGTRAVLEKTIATVKEDDEDAGDVRGLDGETVAVVHGSCDAKSNPTSTLCARDRRGEWREIVLDSAWGSLAASVWASEGSRLIGLLSERNRRCELFATNERRSAPVPCMASPGRTPNIGHAGSLTSDGRLRIVRGGLPGSEVVVEMSFDGDPIRKSLPEHVYFASWGRHALLSRADGTMLESGDHARTWTEVASPPGGVSRATTRAGGPRGWLARCNDQGCAFDDGMMRIGWEL